MSPNNLLYTRGDILKKITHTRPRLDWPSLTFEAALQNEEFQEVSIVTLVSHYEMLCHEKAIDEVSFYDDERKWYKRINQRAKEIMNSGGIKVRESVHIFNNYSGVVVLDDARIEDDSVTRALQMIEQSEIPGTTHFGEPTTFTAEQVAMRKSNETETKTIYNEIDR